MVDISDQKNNSGGYIVTFPMQATIKTVSEMEM
jgi:hypothetical protein